MNVRQSLQKLMSAWRQASWRRRALVMAVPLAVAALALGLSSLLWLGGPSAPKDEAWRRVEPPADAEFVLQPTLADSLGVDPRSEFLLTAKVEVTPQAIEGGLQVQPPLALQIRKGSAVGEFVLSPVAPLSPDTVYRFSLTIAGGEPLPAHSWAFQTKGPFRVVQTLPGDKATEAPLDTGIEVTFSHEQYGDPASFFAVEPPLEGRFERHRRTLAFVPQRLEPHTLYTVTLKAGLPLSDSQETLAEDFLFRFETSDLTRGQTGPPPPTVTFTREVYEFPPTEAPALNVFAYGFESSPPTAEVKVFAFSGRDAFLESLKGRDALPPWAFISRRYYLVDTSGLPLVATFPAPVEGKLVQYGAGGFIRFPEPMGEGYYLVQAAVADGVRQAWLQVTEVATFLSTSRTRTIAWVNDVRDGSPIAGAALSLAGSDLTVATNPEGVAFFDSPPALAQESQEARQYFVVRAPDGREAVVPVASAYELYRPFFGCGVGFFGGPPGPDVDVYWRYLSTDRKLYHPTDSLQFWGVVQQRETGAAPDQAVTVELTRFDCGDKAGFYSCTPLVARQATVSPSSWGSFQGELAFQNLQPGDYQVLLKVGDKEVFNLWGVRVETFVKPAYKLDVEPQQRAVFAGDAATFRVRAQFFEGTAVPNLALRYDGPTSGQITTDSNGEASIVYQPQGNKDAAFPGQELLTVAPVQAEEGEILGQGSLLVFPSRVHLEASTDFANGLGRVRVVAHEVDPSRLNRSEADPRLGFPWPEDYIGSPLSGQVVSGSVVRTDYEKRQVGETYDFINKAVLPRYEYEPVRTPVGSIEMTTGPDGEAVYTFAAESGVSYDISLTASDEAGRGAIIGTSLYTGVNPSISELQPFYLEDVRRTAQGQGFDDFGYRLGYYGFGPRPVTYKVGEPVTMAFKRGQELLPSDQGRYLFLRAKLGILDYAIQGDPTYSFPFAEEHVPNVYVRGVYFNGFTYVVSDFRMAVFDSEERRLHVSVTPDKSEYRPGEPVRLDVSVSDKAGQPVAAEVNLSLVDEALFRLQQMEFTEPADPLFRLYSPVTAGVIHTYASHQYPREFLELGGRGGGDGGVRQEFRDRAFFGVVQTDAEGKGSVSFDLPDNLTSWRITYQAVTPDMRAGSGARQLPVSLPIFVDVALNETYLVGDQPVLKLRAFGSGLTPGQPVEFRLAAPTLGIEGQTVFAGTAFQGVDVPLPALPEGEHRIEVSVRAGAQEDAVARTIKVIRSHLLRQETSFYTLEPGLKLEGSPDTPTVLVFSDRNRGRFYPLLRSLLYGGGDRADQWLARVQAGELLAGYFGEESPPQDFPAQVYQAPDGGVAILPYAGSDLALSARVAALAPDRFDRQALRLYLQRILEDPQEGRERAAIALYGLAALGEPVLVLVQNLLAQPDLEPLESLYLALAALASGDGQTARQVYSDLLARYGEAREPYLRLRVSDSQDDMLEASALAALVAAAVGDPYQEGLFRYFTEERAQDILLDMEAVLYVATALPTLPEGPVRFTYTLDGESKRVELEKGETYKVQLSPEELKRVAFLDIEGQVGVASLYVLPATPADLAKDPSLQLTREYRVNSVSSQEFIETDLVQITIRYAIPDVALQGCYQVTDTLPSGLRPVYRPFRRDVQPTVWYPYRVEGQRVSFCVGKELQLPIVYYARVVNKGQFLAEPAVIQSLRSDESANLSEARTVLVR